MLKYYPETVEALKRLCADGVVSFEYVVVAACIVAAVGAVFGSGGPITTALSGAIYTITIVVTPP